MLWVPAGFRPGDSMQKISIKKVVREASPEALGRREGVGFDGGLS
jgi:hypothetical protein